MRKIVAGVLILAVAGGCYNTYQVPGPELYKLNGYREGQTVTLRADDGEPVPFNHKSSVQLQATDGQSLRTSFSAISVQGNTMTGVVRGSGAPVNIDLSQIAGAEVRNRAVGRTVGLAVGLGLGVPVFIATAIVVGAAIVAASARRVP